MYIARKTSLRNLVRLKGCFTPLISSSTFSVTYVKRGERTIRVMYPLKMPKTIKRVILIINQVKKDVAVKRKDRKPSENRSMMIMIESLIDGKIMDTSVEDWNSFSDEVIEKFSTVKNLELIRAESPDFPIFAIFGKNDEVLSSEAIENTYGDYAVLNILPNLSHNMISTKQWMYIIDKIDEHYLASL